MNIKRTIIVSFVLSCILSIFISLIILRGIELWSLFVITYVIYLAAYGLYVLLEDMGWIVGFVEMN